MPSYVLLTKTDLPKRYGWPLPPEKKRKKIPAKSELSNVSYYSSSYEFRFNVAVKGNI